MLWIELHTSVMFPSGIQHLTERNKFIFHFYFKKQLGIYVERGILLLYFLLLNESIVLPTMSNFAINNKNNR